jgi:hypothetical protein
VLHLETKLQYLLYQRISVLSSGLKLPADQEIKFKEAVITLQEERVGGRITGHDIRQLLDEQFQIKCCPLTVAS